MDKEKKVNISIKNDKKKPAKKKTNKKNFLGFKLGEVIVLIAIATIIGVFSGSFLTYSLVDGKVTRVSSNKEIGEFEEAFNSIVDEYYEKVDKNKLIDAAIDGMLSILDDYTFYMDSEETSDFNERMKGEYKGIGIEFVTTAENEHFVTNVFENTPALTAGVKMGDQIVKIDDLDISKMTGNQIASYIKESNISEIKMVVKREGNDVELTINKAHVSLPSINKKTFESNGKKIGYIGISIFANNTYDQFKKALAELESKNINSLIIDVRNNSGGYLHVTDDILELFLKKGETLYQTKDQNKVHKYYDKTEENRTYPVAVLINNASASASEVLASSLKEIYGAEIIGDTSFGKGTVQQPVDISNGGMIKITTSEWLTPLGNTINKVGVKPTIEVGLGNDYLTNPSDQTDMQLQRAITELAK